MLGWAQPINRVIGVAHPLHARALVVEDLKTRRRVAIVCAEVGFISHSIREGVLQRLRDDHAACGIGPETLMLLATHTHSGPGGFSNDLMFILSTPGFRPDVCDGIVEGITRAIVEACARMTVGRITVCADDLPLSEPVAFNRAWQAYNANPDIPAKVDASTRHHAVDRTMTLLRCDAEDGTPLGVFNWFAVHCTSIHADNRWLHPDNKGFAADYMEDAGATFGNAEFVAAFAQGASGDVTPNFRFDPTRGWTIGTHDDDIRSAADNGWRQFELARRIYERAEPSAGEGEVDAALLWLDFESAVCDPTYTGGLENRRTSYARVGIPFMEGTAEGPGPLYPIRGMNRTISEVTRRLKRLGWLGDEDGELDAHGPKATFIETGRGGEGRAFRFFSMGNPWMFEWVDPTVRAVKELTRAGAMGSRPWTANVVPLQVMQIGTFAIIALPCEPTTQAGRRIRAQALRALAPRGVTQVAIAGYANGYVGYLTTFEEYQLQHYEGGSTYHGQWTLAAYQTQLDRVIRRLANAPAQRPKDPVASPTLPEPHENAARAAQAKPLARAWLRSTA